MRNWELQTLHLNRSWPFSALLIDSSAIWLTQQRFSLRLTSVWQKNIYFRPQCYQLTCASWFSRCPHLIHYPEDSDLSSQPASINHSPYQPDLAVLHRLIHDYLSLGESPVFRLPFPHLSLRHPYLNGWHSLTKRAPLLRLEWPGFLPAKLAPAAECANWGQFIHCKMWPPPTNYLAD